MGFNGSRIDSYLQMDPVFATVVLDASVQCVRGQHEQEMLGCPDVFQQTRVELAGVQAVNINKHLKESRLEWRSWTWHRTAYFISPQLQMDFQ